MTTTAAILSDSQQRFFDLLDTAPRISHLWDREKGEINFKLFDAELGVMSSGEAHIAKFFAAIWFHSNNNYDFDLVDAVSSLDTKERQLIIEWIADPFWP